MVANAGAVDPQDRQDTTTVVAPPARGATQQEATPPEAQGPRCTQEHVLNCQFDRWYPHFKHCTPRSTVLELPEDLVRYLQADGVVLPKGFEMSCGQGVQDDSDDEVDWGDGDDEEDADERPDFPGLQERLSDAIRSLGGSVFPKLNWSCPQDAAWINGGTLKCLLPGDVLCLLKSSTFIDHDLNHAFDGCAAAAISRPDTFTLVLRKWCNLHPSMLFRCFVRERRLVGISQKDCTSYYGFLSEEAGRLSGLLEEFFEAEVCKKFADPDCVADVYVDSRSRVWLLDINPFSSVTDSLLFDWSEDALAAPLPAPTIPPDEETLPEGVFMRLHFEPPRSETTADTGVSDVEEASRDRAEGGGGGGGLAVTRVTVAGGVGTEVEFRCVPSSTHMVPDPMGRYRGPADVGMGTLVGGGAGGLDDFIESCRTAADDDS